VDHLVEILRFVLLACLYYSPSVKSGRGWTINCKGLVVDFSPELIAVVEMPPLFPVICESSLGHNLEEKQSVGMIREMVGGGFLAKMVEFGAHV